MKFKVEVEYNLNADSGTVHLLVQSADNPLLAKKIEVVSRGKGKVTLEAELGVPDTKAIEIVVLLLAQGQTGTEEHDRCSYTVKPR